MAHHPAVPNRLAWLSPDQRAAATARTGPVLCIAPAGSGKTTTLVARIAWLVDQGIDPATIAAITFNRRAATELAERLGDALVPLGLARDAVRVRTFHALGLEILGDAGRPTGPIANRAAILAELVPGAGAAGLAELDTAISRLKVELGVSAAEVALDDEAGPIARTFLAYEKALKASGSLDFDDLVIGARGALAADNVLLERWRGRCGHLLVDEIQDVDRMQLGLVFTLATPRNRIFLVGDDDQSIYGWRLADVRRIFGLAAELAGLEQYRLTTNFRCPAPVVERSVRLVSGNRQRFAKTVRAGPGGRGRLVLAPDDGDDDERIGRVFDTWPEDGSSRAVLARTNVELVPAAAVAVDRGIAFRASGVRLPVDDPSLDSILAAIVRGSDEQPGLPLPILIGQVRTGLCDGDALAASGAVLGWAPRSIPEPPRARRSGRSGFRARRGAPAGLRRLDAGPTLAHLAVRPGGAVAVPARSLRSEGAQLTLSPA